MKKPVRRLLARLALGDDHRQALLEAQGNVVRENHVLILDVLPCEKADTTSQKTNKGEKPNSKL